MRSRFFYILFVFVLSMVGCHQTHVRSASHLGKEKVEKEKVEGSVYFRFDRWTLTPEQVDLLAQKAAFLKANKESTIILEGHTDYVGSSEYNLQLGDRRARQIKLELFKQGINPGRLVVMSYGKDRPLSQSHSAEARQNERRVDFKMK